MKFSLVITDWGLIGFDSFSTRDPMRSPSSPDAARSNRTADFLRETEDAPFEKIHVILDVLLNYQRLTIQPATFKRQHLYNFLATRFQGAQLFDNLCRQYADFRLNKFGKIR